MIPKPEIASTSEVPPSKFRAHGQIAIAIEGDLIVCSCQGPFNLELMRAWITVWKQVAKQWQLTFPPEQPVVILTKWADSMMCPLEVIELHREFLEKVARQHQKASQVWVIPEDLQGQRFMRARWLEPYNTFGMHIETVSSEADGYAAARRLLGGTVSQTAADN